MDRKKIVLDAEVYDKLGACAALVYGYIERWCASHERNGTHFHEGRYWMFDTEKAIADGIGHRGASKISVRRSLDALCKRGFILRDNFNSSRQNRTCWYAIKSHVLNLSTSNCSNVAPSNAQNEQMQVLNLNACNKTIGETTIVETPSACIRARTEADNSVRMSDDPDWRSDLAASLARNAQREAEALALLDEAERSARTDPDHPYPESTLAYCAAQRESVRRTRRLCDAMDRVDYGLEDPAVDCAPLYDETFFDEDGNPYCYGDLTGWYADVESDLLFRVTEFYIEQCWANGKDPTAADFASRETQQLIADCLAHHLAWLDDYYSTYRIAENDPETED